MPQSLAAVNLHIVFSTKNRVKFIDDQTLRQTLHAYLGGTCNWVGCPSICVGGVEDHVHILCHLGKTTSISDLVRDLKSCSSGWMKDHRIGFAWQSGYGAFSLANDGIAAARAYIEKQEEHHKELSFKNEFRRLLVEHGIQIDERYLWD